MSGRTTGILSTGKVKHRNTCYLGIEVTINGEKQIIPPKKRFKEFEIAKSVRYIENISWGLRMHSFRVVAYTTLKVRL
jgi:hypothetical protein